MNCIRAKKDRSLITPLEQVQGGVPLSLVLVLLFGACDVVMDCHDGHEYQYYSIGTPRVALEVKHNKSVATNS